MVHVLVAQDCKVIQSAAAVSRQKQDKHFLLNDKIFQPSLNKVKLFLLECFCLLHGII